MNRGQTFAEVLTHPAAMDKACWVTAGNPALTARTANTYTHFIQPEL